MNIDRNILGHNFIDRDVFIYYREYADDTYMCKRCGISVIATTFGYYATMNNDPTSGSCFDDLISCDEVIIKGIID
jgi:hypothetical protein